MSTLLLKVFPNIRVVCNEGINLLPKSPVELKMIEALISQNSNNFSKPFAENMPDWAVAKFFDPECERKRLVIHDYQQTELEAMRRMVIQS